METFWHVLIQPYYPIPMSPTMLPTQIAKLCKKGSTLIPYARMVTAADSQSLSQIDILLAFIAGLV